MLLGRSVELAADSVFRKLVHDRRGGYCFEQNGLLLRVLGALGFEASALGARVRLQRPREFVPPRTHMFVRVEVSGETWLADVGVGGLSLTSAIRLHADGEQATAHEPRRVVREGGRWVHQVRLGSEWQDVCEFTLDEMPPIDAEVGNWFTSAHPQSHFKNRLMVARALGEGCRATVLDHDFTLRGRDGRAVTRTIGSPGELLELLAEHFGLNFPPDTRFGPPGSPWPR